MVLSGSLPTCTNSGINKPIENFRKSEIFNKSNSSGISSTNAQVYHQGNNKNTNMRCWPFNKDVKPTQNGNSSDSGKVDSLLSEIERLKNVIIDKDKEIEKLKEKQNEELKSREETIRRMQDIIDKSVGGIITLNRQQSRDQQNQGEKGPPMTKYLERPKKQRTGISAEPFNERVIVNTDPKGSVKIGTIRENIEKAIFNFISENNSD
ncbi:Oidioi.mRNA.OKI2018_I69.chr1.g158.t1.cds [Oikopleura dioica]|uniref:Oidioi.mRNA.OKI2018_I69.chr1.g158.t1.cds n=1 Tax=Oikopleura dioica TaxID=34765 RepID=A0ABN7SQ97_OIKDI|nr:Oidioi.mRNA.OKI2018_I69.chr1.g158.t1.cds [Oikopleura dioica]